MGDGTRLNVNGALYAVGTEENTIAFTSYRDDSAGGDTNNDGYSEGAPGDWYRIYFSDSVIDFLARLEYVDVRYAGRYNYNAIHLNQANVTIDHCRITNNACRGIYAYYAAPLIRNTRVADNADTGISLYYSNASLDGNTISDNGGDGVDADASSPVVTGNTLTGNAGWGLCYTSSSNAENTPPLTGNAITGNARSMMIPASAMPDPQAPEEDINILAPNSVNGIWIQGNTRNLDLVFDPLYAGTDHEISTYQIYNTLTIAQGARLTVEPGVTVKFYDHADLDINGTLEAQGTTELPVVFTSYLDYRYGGDLNLNGYSSAPANGDWGSIAFSAQADGSACVFDHAVVRYGGSEDSGMICASGTNISIANSIISNSATAGIRATASSLTLSGNKIFSNSGDGIYLYSSGTATNTGITGSRIFANSGDGIEVRDNVAVTVTGCEIFGNLGYGLNRNSPSPLAVATGNWWGAVDGPGGEAGGSGDNVSAYVTTTGYLTDGTEFHYFNAGGTSHHGYGILQPVVSGTASTEWGTGDTASFLYDLENPITAEYRGLSETSAYRVLVTYLNQDNNAQSIQSLTDISGAVIHPAMPLTADRSVTYDFPVSKDLISGGSLTLRFNRLAGLRAVVSGILLMKETGSESTLPQVHLTAPVNGGLLKQGEILIKGTAGDAGSGLENVEIGIRKGTGSQVWYPATSIGTSGIWVYRWEGMDPGEYTLAARAADRDGNTALAPEKPVIVVDGVAPGPVTHLFAQGKSETAGTMEISWTLSPDDGNGADDVIRYEIYRGEGRFSDFVPAGRVMAGTGRFDDAAVTAGTDYYYQVFTVDQTGYRTGCDTFGPARSNGDADTTPPEDITGLAASATQTGGTNPSVRLTWTRSINSQGDLADQILYTSTDGGANWTLGQSLGISTASTQIAGLTAGQAYLFKITTVDEIPNESGGVQVSITPTGLATQVISLGGTLDLDTTLDAGVYLISSDLTVPEGVTLELLPGTIFKFASGRSMTVNGTLKALGRQDRQIIFTAWTDDTYGGDSNGDGSVTEGTPGYWTYLDFNRTSHNSWLENARVCFAGRSNYSAVYLDYADVPVIACHISQNQGPGIGTTHASSRITGNTIEQNGGHGIYLYYGSPEITANTINANHHGIYSQYAEPAVNDNIITGNTGYGVYHEDVRNTPVMTGNTITGNQVSVMVPLSGLPDETNVLTPNTEKYIGIRGNDIPDDTILRVWGKGTLDETATYLVYSGNVTVPAYTRLTVEPGVTVKFARNLYLYVRGALVADGTLENKIVFTGQTDDQSAGDTNQDGSETVPVNGYWRGITFYESFFDDLSLLNHVKVRYAGGNSSGGIYIEYADIRVENSEISNSSANGIRVYGASPSLVGNDVWGNSADGIRLEYHTNAQVTFSSISSNRSDGIEIDSTSNALATNNRIFTNREYGIRNNSGNVIDATQTWWGDADASGPYQETGNPSGAGDPVTGNVAYEPFTQTAATSFAYVNFSASSHTAGGSLPEPELIQGIESDIWGTDPDRSMAYANDYNGEQVLVDFTGLSLDKRYKVRVSYFNDDPAGSLQSLTGGGPDPVMIHGTMAMPASGPVQYEFSIPTAACSSSGELRLAFVHDNPGTSIRVSVSEIWLMEDIPELTPPRFTQLAYNDVDGSGTLNAGDEYWFTFSEEMDTSLVVNGTTDANDHLAPEGGLVFGTLNQTRWTTDNKTLMVTLTDGFTVTGTQRVTVTGLTDLFGNPAVGSQVLSLSDTVAPVFTGIDWVDTDNDNAVSVGDQYIFHFNETMDPAIITTGTPAANLYMRPAGGLTYGGTNTVSWGADSRNLTVAVTQGFSILGDEQVIPSSFVTDMAGNAVTGSHFLEGRDKTAPVIEAVHFDDRDGSGTVSVGDRYRFDFSEPLRFSALSDYTAEANTNLSAEGKKYGTLNRIQWNSDFTRVEIRITSGVTLEGNETVTPAAVLTDRAGNPVSNTIGLVLTDDVPPLVDQVKTNYVCPVSQTDTYQILVQFNSSMDTSREPSVVINSTGSTHPVVPSGGTWMTTLYPNDTYATPDISLSSGMDGTLSVDVDAARDWNSNPMAPAAAVFACELDATPPANPAVTDVSLSCSGATLSWEGYNAPDDLAGFQIYRSAAGAFDTVDGKSFTNQVGPEARTFLAGPLNLETRYHIAVAAMDRLGNISPAVISHPVFINEPVPPLPDVVVTPGAEPNSALISWEGYDSSLCGFTGFKVFVEESVFSTVSGLTAKAVLGADTNAYPLTGLDRSKTYYIAVIGTNSSGEFTETGAAATWSDPFAGEITTDLVMGAGEQKEIVIHQSMTILNGAVLTIEPGTTLYFEPGTGLAVEKGAILAPGTALLPIVLTSANDPKAAGDWNGVQIRSEDSGSVLSHVFVEYGQGLMVDDAAPQIDAFTARFNAGAGLTVANGGAVATSGALLAYNGTGAALESHAGLSITGSVIKNNTTNAFSDGTATLSAPGNWWGAIAETFVAALIDGDVDYDGFLEYEPVLTPAIGTAGDQVLFSVRGITLNLAARNAEEMRLSENSTFEDVYFDTFASPVDFTLTPIAGEKRIFVEFKSPTGTVSEPVSVMVRYVADGPVIDGFSPEEGMTAVRPLTVSGAAHATLGIRDLEFYVDNVLESSEPSGSLSCTWDIRNLAQGTYRVKLMAHDNGGNVSAVERNVIVSPQPPPAPRITSPSDSMITSTGTVTVKGTAEPGADVKLTRNGFVMDTVQAGINGRFEISGISLQEGDNALIATSQDEVGVSPSSNRVTVVLDSGPPEPPVLETLAARSSGGIQVTWAQPGTGETPAYYRVYKNDGEFSDSDQAVLVTDHVTGLTCADTSALDGTHFYGVTAVDAAGNVSRLSNVETITYDGTAPGFTVAYDQTSPVGVGPLGITLTVDEPLVSAPTLTIRPNGAGTPVSILLAGTGDLTYAGSFEILSGTGTGPARVMASGTDLAGNKVTGNPAGPGLVIDTSGPEGSVIPSLPEPVQTLSAVDLGITLALTEPCQDGTTPLLRFIPPQSGTVTVALTETAGTQWTGTLPLDPAMGSGIGTFTLLAYDELGNESTLITSGKSLEIYNTALPSPTPPPAWLTAGPKAAGKIQLAWAPVDKAETYVVYRSEGECAQAPETAVAQEIAGTSYEDAPSADGPYCYAVKAERRGALSVLSFSAQAAADSVAPQSPENVAVALGSRGVKISWDAPEAEEQPVRYMVYRNGTRVRTITAGSSASFETADYPSNGGDYQYVVASADALGNENPSGPVSFNLAVGAVSSLSALVSNGSVPCLTWEKTDSATVGFNIYRGGVKLNAGLLTGTSFTDQLYAGSSRVIYSVAAVNAQGEESPFRNLEVYPVAIGFAANTDEDGADRSLVANSFNRFEISLANKDASAPVTVNQLTVKLNAGGEDTFDTTLDLNRTIGGGQTHIEKLPVPVGTSLEERVVKISAVQTDEAGSQVVYRKDLVVSDVTNPSYAVDLNLAEVPLAGGYAMVHVCVKNNGYEKMDVVVSRNNGTEPGDIHVAVENEEGLEISRASYQGFPSEYRISNGTAFVRINAGDSLCLDVQVLVPESLSQGDQIRFTGIVDAYSYDFGGTALAGSDPLTGTMDSGITLSEYYGTAVVQKELYANNETVAISGQAIDRATGLPKPGADLKIGFYMRGFKWYENVTTDESGSFSFDYVPSAGVSGEFTIWSAHPDVFDIIDQDRFAFYRLYATPSTAQIRSSKADTLDFQISLINPGDLPLTDFSLDFRAFTLDDEGKQVTEDGLSGKLIVPEGFMVEPGQTRKITLQLSADQDAPDDAGVVYTLVSSQGATAAMTGEVTLVEAVPVLNITSPSIGYVETSLDRGTIETVSVTIKNNGLADLENAVMTLPESLSWITTNLARDESGKVALGDIKVGEERTFDVVLAPPEDTNFGDHSDKFVIEADNSEQQVNVTVYALITSDLSGTAQFTVVNNIGQYVDGATVRIFNNTIHKQIVSQETDTGGQVVVYGLDIGAWTYQVTAPGHSSTSGVVDIAAGQIVDVQSELNKSLVTVTFNVEPVPFTDRYEIKIEQAFEAHVPYPILKFDTPYIDFGVIEPGFTTTVITTLSNIGLKALDDVNITVFDDGVSRMEPLVTYLPRLDAMGSVEVPVRFTYRGENAGQPGGAVSDCASTVFDPTDFLKGLAAIGASGVTNSYWSPTTGAVVCSLIGGYAVAAGFAGVDAIAATLANFAGCIAGSFGSGGGGSGTGGGGGISTSYSVGGGGPGCFTAGSPVLMGDGSRQPIETLKAGDRVRVWDNTASRITKVYQRESDHILELRYAVEDSEGSTRIMRLETTEDHHFWSVDTNRWVPAKALESGSTVAMARGKTADIIEIIRISTPVTVYSLDVETYEAFYANGLLVRQKCGKPDDTGIEQKIQHFLDSKGGPDMPPLESDRQERGDK